MQKLLRLSGLGSKKWWLVVGGLAFLLVIPSLSVVGQGWIGDKVVVAPTITSSSIKLNGVMVCLPHKQRNGPQTMECAYGLQADSGAFYAVRQSGQDPMVDSKYDIGQRVTISGKLSPADKDSIYDIKGTITISDNSN